MKKVDTQQLEKYGHWAAVAENRDTFIAVDWQHMQAIIAELRMARVVIEEARLQREPTPWLRNALANYDDAKFREDDDED